MIKTCEAYKMKASQLFESFMEEAVN